MKKTAFCIMMACLSLCFCPGKLNATGDVTTRTITEISMDPASAASVESGQITTVETRSAHLKNWAEKKHSSAVEREQPVLIISGAALLLIIILLIILL